MLIEPGVLVNDSVAVNALRLDGWPCELPLALLHESRVERTSAGDDVLDPRLR
jgi:hypothetical protein